jgi:hypothetical protein
VNPCGEPHLRIGARSVALFAVAALIGITLAWWCGRGSESKRAAS